MTEPARSAAGDDQRATSPTAKSPRHSYGRSSGAREKLISHAVNHPLRLDVLSVLYERTASPKELGAIIGQDVHSVSYHVRQLLEDQAVELVRVEPRRGVTERYYRGRRPPEISDEEMRAMPAETRRECAALILQAIIAEGLASLRHRQMDSDDDLNLCWMPLQLDEQGHQEIKELQNEMYERVAEIKAGSLGRTGGKPDSEDPVRIMTLMWFGRAANRRGDPAGKGCDG